MKPTRAWAPYVLVAPAVLIFAFVVLIAIVANTMLSFVSWSGIDTLQFIGRGVGDTQHVVVGAAQEGVHRRPPARA